MHPESGIHLSDNWKNRKERAPARAVAEQSEVVKPDPSHNKVNHHSVSRTDRLPSLLLLFLLPSPSKPVAETGNTSIVHSRSHPAQLPDSLTQTAVAAGYQKGGFVRQISTARSGAGNIVLG